MVKHLSLVLATATALALGATAVIPPAATNEAAENVGTLAQACLNDGEVVGAIAGGLGPVEPDAVANRTVDRGDTVCGGADEIR